MRFKGGLILSEQLAPTLCVAEVHADSVTETVRIVQADSATQDVLRVFIVMPLSRDGFAIPTCQTLNSQGPNDHTQ